jgi:hypothetical protein
MPLLLCRCMVGCAEACVSGGDGGSGGEMRQALGAVASASPAPPPAVALQLARAALRTLNGDQSSTAVDEAEALARTVGDRFLVAQQYWPAYRLAQQVGMHWRWPDPHTIGFALELLSRRCTAPSARPLTHVRAFARMGNFGAQCAAVGLHRLATTLFEPLSAVADTDGMYWWLRGLALSSKAEVALLSSSSSTTTAGGAVQAARTLQQASRCFHAAAASAPLAFQQRTTELRARFIHALIAVRCSLQLGGNAGRNEGGGSLSGAASPGLLPLPSPARASAANEAAEALRDIGAEYDAMPAEFISLDAISRRALQMASLQCAAILHAVHAALVTPEPTSSTAASAASAANLQLKLMQYQFQHSDPTLDCSSVDDPRPSLVAAAAPRDVAAALALGRAAMASPSAAAGVNPEVWLSERLDQAMSAMYCQPPFMFTPAHQLSLDATIYAANRALSAVARPGQVREPLHIFIIPPPCLSISLA